MGKFDALLKALGKSEKVIANIGDDAKKSLALVKTAKKAVNLEGDARAQYLKALDEVYGQQQERMQLSDFEIDPNKWLSLQTNEPNLQELPKLTSEGKNFDNTVKRFGKNVIRGKNNADILIHMQNPEVAKLRNESLLIKEQLGELRGLPNSAQAALDPNVFENKFYNKKIENLKNILANVDEQLSQAQSSKALDKLRNEINDLSKQKDDLIRQINRTEKSPIKLVGSEEQLQEKYKNVSKNLDEALTKAAQERQSRGQYTIPLVRKKEANYLPDQPGSYISPNQVAKKDVRSPFAAFDPRFKNSKYLMAGGLAVPIAAIEQQQVQAQMNPMQVMQPALEDYEQVKQKVAEAGARQLNIGGLSPQEEQTLATGLGMAGDPLNYVPGLGEMTAGASFYHTTRQPQSIEQPSQMEAKPMPQEKPIQSVQQTWDTALSDLPSHKYNPNVQYGFTTQPIEELGMSIGSPKQYAQQQQGYPPGNYPMSPMNPEPQQPMGMPQMPQQPKIDLTEAQEDKIQIPTEKVSEQETPMMAALRGYNQGAQEFGFMKGFDDKQKQFEAKMRESYDQEQRAMQEGMDKIRSYDEQLAQMQPKDFWADKSTGSRIAAAIAMGIGAYASAMTGGPNTAKQIIDDTIQRDIATQRERFNRAKDRGAMLRNAYADQVKLYGSQREAEMALQAAYYKNIDQKLKAYETQASTDVQRMNIQRLQQQMAVDLMKLDQERAQQAGQMELSRKIKSGMEIDPTDLSEKDQERYVSDPQFGGLAKSKEHQIKFAPMLASYNNATDMIKTLVYISRNGGASMNPDLAKKATTNALMLQGQLKDPVVSSGAVSESEREMLQKIAANPSDFFSLSSSQQSALEEAQRKMDMNIYNQSKVYMSTPARIPVNDVNQATVKLNGKSFVLPRQKLPQLEIDAKRNKWNLEVISGR
jgi:hypothetical protein